MIFSVDRGLRSVNLGRRKQMKKLLLFGIMVAGLAVPVSAVRVWAGDPPVFAGPFGSLSGGAWGDDQVYDLIAPVHNLPAARSSQEVLYVIGAVDEANPQSLFALPHDRVIPIPAHNHGEFSAMWRALLVEPTSAGLASGLVAYRADTGLAYAVDFGSGFENLTSVEKVEEAEMLGLVKEVDIDFVFVCAVVPSHVVP
jgi:hypothetical protein